MLKFGLVHYHGTFNDCQKRTPSFSQSLRISILDIKNDYIKEMSNFINSSSSEGVEWLINLYPSPLEN